MSTSPTPETKGHRWFAALYDWQNGMWERRVFSKQRPWIVGQTSGRVLEIGVGTGASLPYYSQQAQVVGIEPDPFMLAHARKRVSALGATNIDLRQAPAEELPFESASFDHVVSSLVLCSVREQPRALAEVRRVLKPEGTFRFMEHIRNDESRLSGAMQDLILPVWRWVGAGCHPNRRTVRAIEEAGFRIEERELIKLPFGWRVVVGVARRASAQQIE